MSCLLVILIDCQKGHMCSEKLKSKVSQLISQSVTEWQGHLFSCLEQLKTLPKAKYPLNCRQHVPQQHKACGRGHLYRQPQGRAAQIQKWVAPNKSCGDDNASCARRRRALQRQQGGGHREELHRQTTHWRRRRRGSSRWSWRRRTIPGPWALLLLCIVSLKFFILVQNNRYPWQHSHLSVWVTSIFKIETVTKNIFGWKALLVYVSSAMRACS